MSTRQAVEGQTPARKPRLVGDGKIDMGNGRRLYPCEARAEGLTRFVPNEITKHYHRDETAE